MKKFLILLIFTYLSGQDGLPPFEFRIIDTFVNDDNKVTIQLLNNSKRTISFLEGFVNISKPGEGIIKEIRLTLVENSEPALGHGELRSRSVKFKNVSKEFYTHNFQIAKLKFSEDHRYYTWHPSIGFIRID